MGYRDQKPDLDLEDPGVGSKGHAGVVIAVLKTLRVVRAFEIPSAKPSKVAGKRLGASLLYDDAFGQSATGVKWIWLGSSLRINELLQWAYIAWSWTRVHVSNIKPPENGAKAAAFFGPAVLRRRSQRESTSLSAVLAWKTCKRGK